MDRSEIRRLQKAARDNNKTALRDWIIQFEYSIKRRYDKNFEEAFRRELVKAIDRFLVAVAYTAHFSEVTQLDKNTLPEFFEDLMVTVDLYRTGEYKSDEYKKILEENGILLEDYMYKVKHRKTITLCGDLKYKDEFIKKREELTLDGWIVLTPEVYDIDNLNEEQKKLLSEIHKDKIDLSDAIYVINIIDNINENTQSEIKYALEKGKQIIYLRGEDEKCVE